jgi:hypothetical protein
LPGRLHRNPTNSLDCRAVPRPRVAEENPADAAASAFIPQHGAPIGPAGRIKNYGPIKYAPRQCKSFKTMLTPI